MPEDPPHLPWKDPAGVFPIKPDGISYGFVPRKRGRGKAKFHKVADLERLRAEVAEESPRLVAVPSIDHLVPPSFVPELSDILGAKERKGRRRNFFWHLLSCGVWGFLLWQSFDPKNPGLIFSNLLFFLFVVFGLLPLVRVVYDQFRRSTIPEYELETEAFRHWSNRLPVLPLKALCGAVIAVYITQMIDTFLLPGPRGFAIDKVSAGWDNTIVANEPWRVMTATVSHHYIPLHILLNTVGLYLLGRWCSVLYDWWTTAAVLVVAMLAGTIASLYLPPDVPTVGISGGLCGLLGWLWWASRIARPDFPRGFHRLVAGMVIGLIIYGIVGLSFIDNAAHGGGFLAGWLLAALCRKQLYPLHVGARPLGIASGVICTAFLVTAVAMALYRHLLIP